MMPEVLQPIYTIYEMETLKSNLQARDQHRVWILWVVPYSWRLMFLIGKFSSCLVFGPPGDAIRGRPEGKMGNFRIT